MPNCVQNISIDENIVITLCLYTIYAHLQKFSFSQNLGAGTYKGCLSGLGAGLGENLSFRCQKIVLERNRCQFHIICCRCWLHRDFEKKYVIGAGFTAIFKKVLGARKISIRCQHLGAHFTQVLYICLFIFFLYLYINVFCLTVFTVCITPQ